MVWTWSKKSSEHQNFSKLWNRLKNFKGKRKKQHWLQDGCIMWRAGWKVINPSCSLILIIPEADWGVYSGISNCTHGMNLKLTPEILLDKRCWSITSSLWSHDPCVFYRLEPFCDVKEDWKMTPLIKVFCQRELLVNVSGCQRHLILIYDMILAFPCKSFSVRFDCLKNPQVTSSNSWAAISNLRVQESLNQWKLK